MTTRRWTMAVGALALLTTAAACGGGGGGDSGDGDEVASLGTSDADSDDTTDASVGEPTAEDREDAMLAFAECMREQGVDMPDPQVGEHGETAIAVGGEDMDMEEFEAANEVCQPLMEDAMGDMTMDPEQEAEMQEQLLEYAQCMRDHGIDMEDPQFDGGRVEIHQDDVGDRDDADFQAAEAECAPDGRMGPAAAPSGGAANDADGGDGGDSEPGVVIRTGGGEGEG